MIRYNLFLSKKRVKGRQVFPEVSFVAIKNLSQNISIKANIVDKNPYIRYMDDKRIY